jgi:hypothetical protein
VSEEEENQTLCGICNRVIGEDPHLSVGCDTCSLWFCRGCVDMDELTEDEIEEMDWQCDICKA